MIPSKVKSTKKASLLLISLGFSYLWYIISENSRKTAGIQSQSQECIHILSIKSKFFIILRFIFLFVGLIRSCTLFSLLSFVVFLQKLVFLNMKITLIEFRKMSALLDLRFLFCLLVIHVVTLVIFSGNLIGKTYLSFNISKRFCLELVFSTDFQTSQY